MTVEDALVFAGVSAGDAVVVAEPWGVPRGVWCDLPEQGFLALYFSSKEVPPTRLWDGKDARTVKLLPKYDEVRRAKVIGVQYERKGERLEAGSVPATLRYWSVEAGSKP
jgi:hypothetical protein